MTAPIGLTRAEMAASLRPLPDRESTDTPWHGSAHDLLRRKDDEIARLRRRVADLEADAAVLAVMVRERGGSHV